MHEEMMLDGVVLRTTGSRCIVQTAEGNVIECIVRGKFRIKGIKSTNPVAVGDYVQIEKKTEEQLASIKHILPRKNYILRKAVGQSHKVHILAANIDQAILIFTIDHPRTSEGFADRFLVTAEAYHIPLHIIINKIDLIHTRDQLERFDRIVDTYTDIGYQLTTINALKSQNKDILQKLLENKISFIGGHSGAGKSTLINLVDPALNIKTSNISESSNKGKHTTTFAQMHPLEGGGFVIDSPGIKELGLANFNIEEISHFFPEMRMRLQECKFNDCLHTKEPGCAIKKALGKGEIAQSRYNSYLNMLEEIKQEKII